MKKIKLEDIPAVNSLSRRKLIGFTKEEFYKKEIGDGIPFFSEDELLFIEKKYKEKGITKKEVMAEIYKRGWQIQENTLKSYIQKGLVPKTIKRVKTDKGMISIYPPNMIRHLNFTRYCLFSKDNSIVLLSSLLEKIGQDDKTYLEDVSLEIDNSGFVADDCIHALYVGIFRLEQEGIPWVAESIEKAFKHDESKKQMYLKKLKEVEKIYEQLQNKISEFVKMLENNTTPYGLAEESLDLVKSLESLKERQ